MTNVYNFPENINSSPNMESCSMITPHSPTIILEFPVLYYTFLSKFQFLRSPLLPLGLPIILLGMDLGIFCKLHTKFRRRYNWQITLEYLDFKIVVSYPNASRRPDVSSIRTKGLEQVYLEMVREAGKTCTVSM